MGAVRLASTCYLAVCLVCFVFCLGFIWGLFWGRRNPVEGKKAAQHVLRGDGSFHLQVCVLAGRVDLLRFKVILIGLALLFPLPPSLNWKVRLPTDWLGFAARISLIDPVCSLSVGMLCFVEPPTTARTPFSCDVDPQRGLGRAEQNCRNFSRFR